MALQTLAQIQKKNDAACRRRMAAFAVADDEAAGARDWHVMGRTDPKRVAEGKLVQDAFAAGFKKALVMMQRGELKV